MPTATFFRLPEEKRARLMDACWAEVIRVRFSEVSINRIIQAARIPRGSFYQYFEDKEDLIRYLLEDLRQYFITLLRDILVEAKGDLFALPLMAYDRFISQQGRTDPMLTVFIRVITLNKGIDMQNFMGGPLSFLPDALWEAVDPSRLRHCSRAYADQVFHLACAVLAFAVVETLDCLERPDFSTQAVRQVRDPAQTARIRELINLRVDMLRYGGASDSYKEEHT